MRRRITLLAAATALLAVVLLAVPLAVVAAHGYVNDERLELQRAAATAAAAIRGDRPQVSALKIDRSEISASVYDSSGTLLDGAGPKRGGALVTSAVAGTEATETTGAGISVAAPVSDGDRVTSVVVLRANVSAAHHRTLIASLILAAIGASAVLVAAIGATVVARRLAAPIDRLRVGAHLMGGGDLDTRVAMSGIAEFDVLAATLNESAARIQNMIGRERSLSAEVSHQLRTPVTGLRLELEALAQSHPDDARIGSALQSVDRLSATISDIIALARDLPLRQESSVAQLLTDVEQRWRGLLADATRPLRVSSEPDLPAIIALSSAAAAQILDILIDNARAHGRGAISVHARSLGTAIAIDVTDEGQGVTRAPHELFGERDGTRAGGIGLPFARKLAQAESARLILTAVAPPTFSLVADSVDAQSAVTER
ncbi:MAG: HAMP domain-containing histidine kinase [Actinomycetota bacterium]|nr:HAMP domain-containing histidine kinase [Actinomycetota bacterium]